MFQHEHAPPFHRIVSSLETMKCLSACPWQRYFKPFNWLPLITFANSLDPDQAWQNVRPNQDPNCLALKTKNFFEKVDFEKDQQTTEKHAKLPRKRESQLQQLQTAIFVICFSWVLEKISPNIYKQTIHMKYPANLVSLRRPDLPAALNP